MDFTESKKLFVNGNPTLWLGGRECVGLPPTLDPLAARMTTQRPALPPDSPAMVTPETPVTAPAGDQSQPVDPSEPNMPWSVIQPWINLIQNAAPRHLRRIGCADSYVGARQWDPWIRGVHPGWGRCRASSGLALRLVTAAPRKPKSPSRVGDTP